MIILEYKKKKINSTKKIKKFFTVIYDTLFNTNYILYKFFFVFFYYY
jgi:hypothetical protein